MKKYDNLGYNKELKLLARALRKNSTPEETGLWTELPCPVLNLIADFMSKDLQMIREVDENAQVDEEVMNDKMDVFGSTEESRDKNRPGAPTGKRGTGAFGDDSSVSIREKFTNYIHRLQDEICDRLEELDGRSIFHHDDWDREGGGGGHTRVISKGDVFEKGGVNVSTVHGELPDLIRERFGVEEGWFWAGGLSLVLHPQNPMVPTVHANFRYFELYEDEGRTDIRDRWFGGGIDLTPYYIWDEDAVYFHRVLKNSCDKHGNELYPRFKQECDDYFYNDHRGEARGIGGLFFDYVRPGTDYSVNDWYHFTTGVGNSFLDSYVPIVERRKDEPFEEQHRYFQEIRRGRYVEFNLIYDRGTLFGLKTKGRTESILMSLPPRVRWDYDYRVEKESREAYTLERLKHPIDWIEYGREKKIETKIPGAR